MAITIPTELDYVLDLLGYEWPNVDEDAVHELATLTRGLRDDLQVTLDDLDRRIHHDFAEAFECRAAASFIEAYQDNKTRNVDQILALLPGIADGIDLFGDAVVVLKTKVIAELTITVAQLAAAAATAVATGGASLLANGALLAARKKALDVATDYLVDQVSGQLVAMVIEPLSGTMMAYLDAMVDAPITTSTGGEAPGFQVSYDLMYQLADAIDDCGADQEDIWLTYVSRVGGLPLTGE